MTSPGLTGGHHRIDSYDGVRAVAVIAVVAFHARLGLTPGGYLGVDVFFVLSGFLITGLLLRESASRGRIDLVAFWFRRVRRLVPAALVAIVGTSMMFALVATNPERQGAIPDARAASLWFANWHFIGEAEDYFRGDVVDSPFLHFWSLSVEEQFYVAWPLVVGGALAVPVLRRLLRNRATIVVVPLAAATYAYVAAGIDPLRAYYATDTRVYQLLAGAGVAAWFATRSGANGQEREPRLARPLGQPLVEDRGAVPASTIAAIAEWSVVVAVATWLLVDGGIAPRDAGLLATVLTVWVVLRLAPDSPWYRPGLVTALLSRPTPVRIGRLSYGIYLWHWPVIVVAGRLVEMSAPTRFAVAIVGSFACAAASWMFVEQPIQQFTARTGQRRGRLSVIGLGLGSSVAVALVVVPLALSDSLPLLRAVDRPGFTPIEQQVGVPVHTTPAGGDTSLPPPSSVAPGASPAPSSTDTPSPTIASTVPVTPVPDDAGLIAYDEELADSNRCVLGVSDDPTDCIVVAEGAPTILVIGDSHAARLAPAFTDVARRNGGTVATALGFGCPWQTTMLYRNYADDAERRQCRAVHREVVERVIPVLQPDVIVAVGHPVLEPGWGAVADDAGDTLDAAGLRTQTDAALAELAAAAGDAEIIVVQPTPSAPYEPLECLDVADNVEQCDFAVGDVTMQEWASIDDAAAAHPTARTATIHGLVCPSRTFCTAITDGILVRQDRDHLYHGFVQRHADEIVDLILDE